jgi:hypothetical protein
VFCLIAT